jgi:MFS family permease
MTSSVERLAPPPDSLWRHRDFLLFWSGETISLFGSQVTVLALPLTAIFVLHATPFELGLLNAASFAPFLVATLPAGAWLDRRRKRPVLLASNLIRASVIGVVPIAAVGGWLSLELLYAVALLHGVLAVMYDVGWLSFVPSLVSRERVVAANSRLQASASAAQVGGPGIGGILVQVLTAPAALAVDACSFAFSAVTLALLHPKEPSRRADRPRHLVSEIVDGLTVTFRNPKLRAMALNAAAFNLFDQVIYTVFLLYAVGPLGLSAGLVGGIIGVGAIGSLIGALGAERLGQRIGIGRAMIAMSVVGSITAVAIPFVGGDKPAIVALLSGVFLVQGIGLGVTNVYFVSLRQALTPSDLLGRMNASYRTITFGAIPVGALVGGVLAQLIGLRGALLIGGIGLLCTPLLIMASPVRGVRELPSEPEIPAAAQGRSASATSQ